MVKRMTVEEKQRAKELRENGWTYKQIAETLGHSASTICVALNPASAERKKKAHRRYYAEHKEQWKTRYAEHRRQYYAEHKEQISERRRTYDKAYRQAYYKEHKEHHKAYMAKYRATHKKEIRENQKRHRAEREARDAIRRAQIKNDLAELTPEEKEQVKEIYRRAKEDKNVRCYICGKKIPMGERHVDHIIPISKGGTSKPSNLAIACKECNLRKHAKTPEEIGLLL